MFLNFLGVRIEIGGLPNRYCLSPRDNKTERKIQPGCVDDLNEAELQLLRNQGISNITLSPGHRICYCDTDLCNDGNLLPTNGGGSFIIILISLLVSN